MEVPDEPIEEIYNAPIEEETPVQEDDDEDIIEIDTDEHFGRGNTGKRQKKVPKVEDLAADEMLYDLC